MKHARLLITSILGLGLAFALLWALRGSSSSALAERNLAFIPPTLARQHDPVVITGSLFSRLAGSPLDEIFVVAYHDTTPTQIPFQVDERNAGGAYVAVEDGLLDDNDELVFMAVDGGGWVDLPLVDDGGATITSTFIVTLTDPLSDAHAWVYVFHSAVLTRNTTADYVSYDGDNDRIASSGRYAIGFNATHGFRDYLTLGDSNLDLLDRDKLRITGTVSIPPFPPASISANEQDVTKEAAYTIDGPIRVTQISTFTFSVLGEQVQLTTTLFAYRSLVMQAANAFVLGDLVHVVSQRTSVDWNEQVVGMVYYDANTPTGVTIDGVADVITINPPSRWTQVSGVTGTVVSVSDIPAGLWGIQSTYYNDDGALDVEDTGDQRSYGDAGFQVEDPTPGTFTVLGHFYFLTGTTANVGATYFDYYEHPLQVDVAIVPPAPAPPLWHIYMPLVFQEEP